MIPDHCPLQYRRIIKKFLLQHGEETEYIPEDAEKYIEQLRQSKNLTKENQRLHVSALKWFYKHVLGMKFKMKTPYRNRQIPDTLTFEEVQRLLKCIPEKYVLILQFIYGLGLKVGEALSLRIKDMDLNNGKVYLSKEREIPVPNAIFEALRQHLKNRQKEYIKDRKKNYCFIRKVDGKISESFEEQPFFTSSKFTKLKGSSLMGRQFLNRSTLHSHLQNAQRKAKIYKTVTTMTLRHSFALHQVKNECNIVELSKYLGHTDVRMTLHYQKQINKICSTPFDLLKYPERKEIVSRLNELQNYPDELEFNEFIWNHASKVEFISITNVQESWEKWKVQIEGNHQNFKETADEDLSESFDYILLDMRKLHRFKVLKKVRTIHKLLIRSNKRLLIFYESSKQ